MSTRNATPVADGDGVVVVLAVLAAVVAARGMLPTADASAAPGGALAAQVGERVTLSGARVRSVPADEGFWVDRGGDRVWVQIATTRESPYTVRRGDRVTLTGEVVSHRSDFPARVGVVSAEGASDLAGQAAHISVGLNGISIDH